MTPADKKTYEKLAADGRAMLDAASKMKAADDFEASTALVGRYFKVKNSFSDPKGPKDYWWIYSKVKKVGEFGGWVLVFQFQTDTHGKSMVNPDVEERDNFMTYGAKNKEIKAKEFVTAWHKLLADFHAIGLE